MNQPPTTTAEQLDGLSIHPTAKLIIEYACRTLPRDISMREIQHRFLVSRVEAELAFRQLRSGKPEMVGLIDKPLDGSLVRVPLTSPAREIYAQRAYVRQDFPSLPSTPKPSLLSKVRQ